MAALAGLGSLGHFDLNLIGAAQVGAGHAEAARGHLFDAAVGVRPETVGRLAAFTGIGLCSDGIHGPGQGLMGLSGKRAEAHGPGLEMADDAVDRFYLVQRDRRPCRNKFQ